MVAPLELTVPQARRLAVRGQLLSSPRPRSIEEVARGLGKIQLDPTSAVARTERLVFFSRLGRRFRVAELERMLWTERRLFEYWAEIVPIADFAIHRETMRRWPRGTSVQADRERAFQAANKSFRRYILRELRERGPLRSRDLEDRSSELWRSGGWRDGSVQRATGRLLESLWCRGEVMIVGRDGQQRIWDLAERSLPVGEPRLPQREVARRIVGGQLRARGVATSTQFAHAFDGRPPGYERALAELVKEGVAVPARVRGLKGEWFAHADVLERPFRPRAVLLSPFDDLISNRDRTEALFDFFYRIEIYVPKQKRRWGYFVLPVLRGDRLIGRVSPRFHRKDRLFEVEAVYAEDDADAGDGPAVAASIAELAGWLGARDVRVGSKVPRQWRASLRA